MEVIRNIIKRQLLACVSRQEADPEVYPKIYPETEICLTCSNLRGDKLSLSNPRPLKFEQLLQSSNECCTCSLLMKGIIHCVPKVCQAIDVCLTAVEAPYMREQSGPALRVAVRGMLLEGRLEEKVEFFSPEGTLMRFIC